MLALWLVAQDFRLELVLEYLRHVVNCGVKNRDVDSVGVEDVQNFGDDISSVTNESGSRLDEDFCVGATLQYFDGLAQRRSVCAFSEHIPAAQIQPVQIEGNLSEAAFHTGDGCQQVAEVVGLAVGVEHEAIEASPLER